MHLFLLLFQLITSLLFFYQQIIEDDFEGNGTITEWVGDACGVDASFSNPYVQEGNTSATVLEYTDTGGQYANIRFDTTENIDFSEKKTFTFKIYIPSGSITGNQTNRVSVKLQDGTLATPWITQSEVIKPVYLDQWQEVSFDFENDPYINFVPSLAPPTERTDFNRVLIQVNGENNNDFVTAFVDDFIFEETEDQIDDPVFNSLVWSDEFNGTGAVDASKWHHQTIPIIGGVNWANGEQQHYTDQITNSYVSNGTLKIKTIRENYTFNNVTKPYTSARLNSKFVFQYGRVDVRAKLPVEGGTWPAIWTLGANVDEIGNYFGAIYGSVGWPSCGEIDIMEQNGWDKTDLIGYLHYMNATTNSYQSEGATTYIANSSGEFHIYSLIWNQDYIQILLDNSVFFERENSEEVPYDNPHYLLLNIAMGGNLGGDIPSDFSEAVMEVDYVRVYQEDALSSTFETVQEEPIVYPNPVENNARIKVPEYLVGTKVAIYSILGQKLMTFSLTSTDTSFNFSSFTRGMYLLKFESKLGIFTKEIFKK